MKEKKQLLPGGRIIKTFIAIVISLFISKKIFHFVGFYMTIAVLLSLKKDRQSTQAYGKRRFVGTLMGGIVGYFFMLAIQQIGIQPDTMTALLMEAGGSFFLLWVCKLAKLTEAEASLGCVVFFSVVLNHFDDVVLPFVVMRVVETMVGIVIAICVNTWDTKRIIHKIKGVSIKAR